MMRSMDEKSKNIALILAGKTPVPATRGGATQAMLTHLIDENERNKNIALTFYSYYDEQAYRISKSYQCTEVKYYRPNRIWDSIYGLPSRILRKLSGGRVSVRTRFVRWCVRDIRRQEFDAVIIEGNYFQTIQLKMALQIPVILHMHIDGLNKETKDGKKIVNSCKAILAISDYCRGRIAEIDPARKETIYLLKNTIDTKHFCTDDLEEDRRRIRSRYGIDDLQKVFLYCGRVDEVKGVRELVQAFLHVNNSQTHLMIVGSSAYLDGKSTAYYREIERMAKGCERIHLTGYISQKELPVYYAASDVAVVPSKWQEAAGNVIIEAMACGLPVIATKRGGIPEYADRRACLLVDVGDDFINSLERAMAQMIEDEERYSDMKRNAREIALQYDKGVYYKNFCTLLNQILG